MALAGDIVAMDDALTVTRDGRLYLDKGAIVAIRRATDPAPAGFESVSVLNTGGTIFPGLIELHNHLAYNALRLWQVPKKYNNRDQWSGIPEYRKLVSGPMTVVGKSPGLLPALIRYVEAKCLVGGVTTSQGIALFSNAGIRRFYRGIVRNVEETDDENLPEVETRIADVEAQSAQKFLARLKRETCFLLHLSEGLDAKAREHFLALNFAPNEWAITPQLTGIHCAALKPEDFTVFGQLGGAMVWSPLSNLLLYGGTANIAAAIAAGVRIGIGSDWSPSGSKNLLGELKVAWLVAQQIGGIARHDIIAMATRTAAKILGWGSVLGTIEPGKLADLIVVDGTSRGSLRPVNSRQGNRSNTCCHQRCAAFRAKHIHVCARGDGRGVDDRRPKANTVPQAGHSRSGCGSDQAVAGDGDAQGCALKAACTSEGVGAAAAGRHDWP